MKIHQLPSLFCCFSSKIGICCHPAPIKNVPKYWYCRRLVAEWQQKHNFFRFKHFGHKSLVQIKVLLRVVDEKLVGK